LAVPVWDAEVTVDAGLARRLLGEQFPELASLSLVLLGEGWDNTVFAAGDEWVVRFPRREVVVVGIEAEIALLPELAGLLPVPVPVPELVGVPSDLFPWPWFAARLLPGAELCESPQTSRARIAPQLGRVLRTLHGRDVFDALGGRLPDNPTRRADLHLRVPVVLEKLAAVEELWRPPAIVQALLDDGLALPPPRPRAICHGDLHFRHVLVSGDHVTGLIDWIDLCRGDPALDLQLVWSVLPADARAAFIDEYGEVDEETLLRARVLAVFLGLMLLDYAHAEGFGAIEREALASLDRATRD
jgi:aminoglycoside phosphotransferase (APT) family kinase protein